MLIQAVKWIANGFFIRNRWKKEQKHLTRTPRYIIMEQDTNVSSKGEKIWYRKKN